MCQSQKMVQHTQTIRWLLPTNCLSVFDHFVGLPLEGFKLIKLSFLVKVRFGGLYILQQELPF